MDERFPVPQRLRVVGYAAAVWAFLFAAVNLYWGLGGTLGVNTLGDRIAEQALAGDPELLLVNAVSVVGKIFIGLLGLALVHLWERRLLGELLRVAVWAVGILLAFYGVGCAVQHAMMAAGSIPITSSLGSLSAVQSHLFIWDPVWILGGILFLLTAWNFTTHKPMAR